MKRSALLFFIILIFSGISYGLINSSINGLKLNDMLLEDKRIYVYGDFSSVASNDFAKLPNGYYSLNGYLGEYRYHGFDFSFNPFSNKDFPNDANTNISLENKKWIIEGWKLKGYTSNVFYDYCLNGEEKSATFLKGAYVEMLPFKFSKNNDTYKYLYISQFPTITSFGEGLMVHETENGIWYQTFSLDILKHKLPTNVKIDIDSVKEEDFDLIKLNKKIDVKVTGILEDTDIVNDTVLKSIYYNREDIDLFVFNVNGKEIKTVPNYIYNASKVESTIYLSQIDFERGFIDVNVSFYIVYKNGDVSDSESVTKRYSFDTANTLFSYFNTGNFLVDNKVKRSDIVYFNLSKGKIDEYEIKFEYKGIEKVYFLYNLNINESVKDYLFDFIEQNEIPLYSPITISQIVRNDFSESEYKDTVMLVSKDAGINMDFTIPSEIFDVEHITVVNNTDMTKVKSSKVFVNNQEVDFKYFVSGNYFYGMIDKDVLVNVEIEMMSFNDVKYSYKTWILVKTSIPFIDFKQDSIAREKESILFINNESLVNSPEKLSKYPINYSVKSKDGTYSFESKDLILMYNTPGVYRITICASNAFRKAYKDYRVIVSENLPPTVNFHIYDNQIYRGELLEYYIEVISPDGDELIDKEVILYKDLDVDGVYELSEVFNPNYIFSEMGNYKLVAKASEKLKNVIVEREFTVCNHMPITTLSIDSTKAPEKIDLLIVSEDEIVMQNVSSNILLYEEQLSKKGYDAKVEYFFNNSINYSLDVNEVVNTGSSYPSNFISYSKDGYEGILYLYAIQDIGSYVDYGYYTTRTTCRDIPIYGKIRSCDICGTYINPLGFKMCKFCYTVIGTTRQCTTRRYWVSNLVWVPSYRGYYSGTAYKKVSNIYEDRYREDADKYLFYIDGDMEDEMEWSNKTENMYLIEGNSVSEKIDEIFESSLVYPNTFLVDEVFDLKYGNFDFENDPIIKEEFIVTHNNLVFDHPMGLYERNNLWTSFKPNVFSSAGVYEIKRRIFDYTSPPEFSKQSNVPSVYLKIHRIPISSFYINIYPKLELVDNSYDPDYHYQREERGIVETKVIIEDESFNKIYGLPDELLPGKYKVSYYVKDVDGAWGVSQKNIVVDYNSPYVRGSVNPKVLPIDDVVTISDIYVYSSGSTNLRIGLYNDDGFVKDISNESFIGSLSGIKISNKDFIIPRSFTDGVYYFVFYINGSEKLFLKFDVFSPICLDVTSIGKVKRDSIIIIEATVKDYVDDVFFIEDGSYHEMVKEGDRWVYEIAADTEDMFVRASLNNKFEMEKVDIQIVDEFITDFYMIGDWSYWRGQLNMFSNRVSYNRLRFMSLEHVTVVVEVLGEMDEIILNSSDNLKDVKFNNYHNFSELNLTFPVIVKRSGSNKFVYDFILPIVRSSLDKGNVRVSDSYYLTVKYGDVERSISFDITGNIYDRVFIQPMY